MEGRLDGGPNKVVGYRHPALRAVVEMLLTTIKEEVYQIPVRRIHIMTSCTVDKDWAVFKGFFGSMRLLELLHIETQPQTVPFLSVSM